MKIIETNLSFGPLSYDNSKRHIILHHADASECSAAEIHAWHTRKGWSGIGYHFLVRKNGNIERGRPEKAVGAHTNGYNTGSIGICFEGDYMHEVMPTKQLESGKQLISWLKGRYPITYVKVHKDFNSTDCPGTKFPVKELTGSIGVITRPPYSKPVDGWVKRLQQECNAQGFSCQAVDGIKGPNTLAGCPQVKRGAQGGITKLIQEKLTALGIPCGRIDGIFGTNTEKGVRTFQSMRAIAVDGIVGPNTWRELLGM